MAFEPGNQLWRTRSSHGRNPLFSDPEALWNACCEYFQWVEANPLKEAQAFAYQGEVKLQELPKMRAMSLGALCVFLDIARSTWNAYRENPDFSEVTARVEEITRSQKFEGASAGLLNANIIARDLGLTDKSELSGKDGAPLIPEQKSSTDVAKALLFILDGARREADQD